jgi:hypothetical protein
MENNRNENYSKIISTAQAETKVEEHDIVHTPPLSIGKKQLP